MSRFGLDPHSIAERVKASGVPARVPTLAQSMLRGVIGFTIVSVAGFMPWVLAGKWFYRNPGEWVMYTSCAAVFIGLSGLLLHPLIIGPGSLKRFYIVFSVAFAAYSCAWIAGWMGLRGQHMHVRSAVGLFAGTVVMGVILAVAFEARAHIPTIVAVLFLSNSLGYFAGGWIEGYLAKLDEFSLAGIRLSGSALDIFMKALWGGCYGIGFGAGLGVAFHTAQAGVRVLLSRPDAQPPA